jgi:hypothetical protein
MGGAVEGGGRVGCSLTPPVRFSPHVDSTDGAVGDEQRVGWGYWGAWAGIGADLGTAGVAARPFETRPQTQNPWVIELRHLSMCKGNRVTTSARVHQLPPCRSFTSRMPWHDCTRCSPHTTPARFPLVPFTSPHQLPPPAHRHILHPSRWLSSPSCPTSTGVLRKPNLLAWRKCAANNEISITTSPSAAAGRLIG